MVRAVHSKTYLTFVVVLIEIYCITIEEAYCAATEANDDHLTPPLSINRSSSINRPESNPVNSINNESADVFSFEKRRPSSLVKTNRIPFETQTLNTSICISQILVDLDCETAVSCAIHMFNRHTYDELQDFTKKYIKYVYRYMILGSLKINNVNDNTDETTELIIYSPFEMCKIKINENGIILEKPRVYTKCIMAFEAAGFWNTYASTAVERIFFWTKIKKFEDTDHITYGNYIRNSYTTNNTELTFAHTPSTFCRDSCDTQLKFAFGGLRTANGCARYAFLFLMKDDLMEYARSYLQYLSTFIQLRIDRQSRDTPDWYCETFANQNKRAPLKMTKVQIKQRISACKFDLDIYYNILKTIKKDNVDDDDDYVNLAFVLYVYFNISIVYMDVASDAMYYHKNMLMNTTVDFRGLLDAKDPSEYCRET